MSAPGPRTGQCLCGAVRFTAAELGGFGVCHCKMCQRHLGSAMFGVTVNAGHMTIEGAENVGTYVSSTWASRAFCTRCGSSLWYRYDPRKDGGGTYEIPIGLLDDGNGLTIARELFIDRKSDSFEIAGDHPRLTEAEVEQMYSSSQQGA